MNKVFKVTGKYIIILALFIALLILNFKVWRKDHEKEQKIRNLQKELSYQLEENDKVRQTNQILKSKIDSLKIGSHEMIEEKAREDFNMVGGDETYFQ